MFKNTKFKDWLPALALFIIIGAAIFLPLIKSDEVIWWWIPAYIGSWLLLIFYARVIKPKLERKIQ